VFALLFTILDYIYCVCGFAVRVLLIANFLRCSVLQNPQHHTHTHTHTHIQHPLELEKAKKVWGMLSQLLKGDGADVTTMYRFDNKKSILRLYPTRP
jgi:hypothetical protein